MVLDFPPSSTPESPWRVAAGFVSVVVLLFSSTACTPMEKESSESRVEPTPAVEPAAQAVVEPCSADDVQWSYEGATGPDRWAGLSPCFALCDSGTAQSPIDLPSPSERQALPVLNFKYTKAPLRMINDGHTVLVEHDGKSSLDFGEMTFGLRQLHFHSPSEHTRQGKESPIEMHLVHSSAGGNLTVVAVMIEPGADNPGLAGFWDHLPTTAGARSEPQGVEVDAAALLPDSLESSRYSGSLTTPPCNEGVRWIVLDEPITLSQEKIDRFRTLFDGNRRPLQPLGERQVRASGGQG